MPTRQNVIRKALLVFCCFVLGAVTLAEGKVIDSPGGLDLKDVVKAINFGITTDQVIGGVTFRAAGANSTVDGVKNTALGAVNVGAGRQTLPNIGSSDDDNALEQILGTSILGSNQTKNNIEMNISVPNGYYKAQLIIYDGWKAVTGGTRNVNHYAEGTKCAVNRDDYVEQGNTPNAGSVSSYVFEVIDGEINLKLEGLVPNAHLSGVVINKLSSLNAVDLKPGDSFVQYDIGESKRNALMESLAPEIREQYLTLEDHLIKRSMFDKVAKQTLRQDALILKTDRDPVDVVLRRTAALLTDIQKMNDATDMSGFAAELKQLQEEAAKQNDLQTPERIEIYAETCKLRRRIAFSNPLVRGIKDIAFIKRHGALLTHMVDQFYGIAAMPGGGLYVLEDAFSDDQKVRDVLANAVVEKGSLKGQKLSGGRSKRWNMRFHDGWQTSQVPTLFGEETEGGAFLSPELSFDGKQILFAYTECKGSRIHHAHMDHSKGHWDEGRVYNIFKINVDGSGLEQITD
ncbi:hypothetical protein LCGC14_1554280, partial [marine sediment metagenome]